MSSQTTVKVFIGSGEASVIECRTAIHSLRKHTKRDLDIYVFNGTHNAIRLNDGEPFLAPMSLKVKYQNITEFSLYRYLIPQLCDFQGRAIYIDSDTVCLSDIGELFEAAGLLMRNLRDGALALTRFALDRIASDFIAQIGEVDELVGLPSQFIGDHRRPGRERRHNAGSAAFRLHRAN